MFHICLYRLIGVLSTYQSFSIKNGVGGVDGGLILGGITDETFSSFCEGNIGGGDTVALVVGNNIDLPIFENTYAGISGTEINADNGGVIICTVRRRPGDNRRHEKEANERQEKKTDDESSSKSSTFLVSFQAKMRAIAATEGHGC